MKAALLNDIIEWDVNNWSQALKIWQPAIDKLPRTAKVLAIGERNGGLTLWLALQGFTVLCTDRNGVTENAKMLHAKYGVTTNISYANLDIVNDTPSTAQYDLIIMKSVLGGLKEQYNKAESRTRVARQKAINNIYTMLQPGGVLLTADNLQGSYLLKTFRELKGKNRQWYYFNMQELKTLFIHFSRTDVYTFGIIPTRFSKPLLNRLAYALNKILKRFFPQGSSYISVTIASK
ncbi:MAG: class I SAM-dependent methyltransferase [Flavipsychrobacter sp.]|nr:class I SAM-dependent methyltransferase [Flavipsychrobacter sp.]